MGKGQQRGLSAENPNLQTFEIYLPFKMLAYYRDLYFKQINNEILTTHNNKTYNQNPVQNALYRQKALPAGINMGNLEEPGVFINRMM
jgi:hypothetical protein